MEQFQYIVLEGRHIYRFTHEEVVIPTPFFAMSRSTGFLLLLWLYSATFSLPIFLTDFLRLPFLGL